MKSFKQLYSESRSAGTAIARQAARNRAFAQKKKRDHEYEMKWGKKKDRREIGEAHSAGYKMPQRSNETEGNFEVKWATNKKGPIQVAKGFKTHTDAKDWLAAQQKDDKRIKGIVVNKDFKIDRKRKTRKEEVEQVDEISRKTAMKAYAKAATARYRQHDGSNTRYTGDVSDPVYKRRAERLKNKIQKKFGDKTAKDAEKLAKLHHTKPGHDTSELEKRSKRAKGRKEMEKSDRTGRKTHVVKDKLKLRSPGTKINPKSGKINKQDAEWLKNQMKGNIDKIRFANKHRQRNYGEEVEQVGEAEGKPYPAGWKVKKSHQSTVAHDATKSYIKKSGYADDIKRDKPKNVIAYVARRKSEAKKANEGYGGLSKSEYEKAKAKPPQQTKQTPPATPMSTSRVIARALKRSKKPSQRLTSGFSEEGMIGRTKPSRELNVSRDEKPYLAGKSSLKAQKRAAHKAERAKAKKKLKQPVSEAKRKMGNVKDVPVYREIEGKKGHHEVVGHVHRSAKSVGAAKVGNAATARQTMKLKGPEFPEGPGWVVQDKLR